MAIGTIATIASLALKVGPAAIRGISSLFGGSETADKVAEAVEKVDSVIGMTKEQKEVAVTRQLQSLPPEAMVDLKRLEVEMQKDLTRRMELELGDNQAEHHETQTTIRNGDNADDEYVRQTRPKIARQSFWMMCLYVFLFEGLSALGVGDGANIYVALTIGAFAYAYFGLRTMDGFAPYSKSSGDKVMGAIGNVIKGRK